MNQDSLYHLEESVLSQRARSGDRRALGLLLERHRVDLVRFCYRYLGSLEDAEDATQDVLSHLLAVELPEVSFRAWLYRCARNRCLNLTRRRGDGRVGAVTFFSESRLPRSPRTGPATALGRAEQQEMIRRILAELSPAHAEVLSLRYLEDLSRKEIAEVLELPESVVKSRLFEGAQAMRRRLPGGER